MTFTGLVPKNCIPDILSVCDVALVYLEDKPLFRTVIPSKIFEAAAAGKPIIVGVPGYASRLVTESDSGVAVNPGDAKALYDVLIDLSDDSDRLQIMGESARKQIAETHEWDILAECYLSILIEQESEYTE